MGMRNVFVHLTSACNLRCKYCYFSASKPQLDEMTTNEVIRLWPSIITIRPQKIVITGGEPLLRQDLIELLRAFRHIDPDHQIRCCLNSNGHLVTPELAADLSGLVDEIRISLDGLRDGNDALRGQGNFDSAMWALRCFVNAGMEPRAVVTVTSETVSDLEALFGVLISERITQIKLNAFRPIGRGREWSDLRVNRDVTVAALDRAWKTVFPDLQKVPVLTTTRNIQSHCGVGKFVNIMPNGDVFPCHVLTDPEFYCGNVREQNLSDICERHPLLVALRSLNFQNIVKEDGFVEALAEPGSCMGLVYADTRARPIWQRYLPL
jgi:MoaA/NifB/PqqE/SkfB family radical SAM enzyme